MRWRRLPPGPLGVLDGCGRCDACGGRTNAVIAVELLMRAETLKTHTCRIYAKLSVATRVAQPAGGPTAEMRVSVVFAGFINPLTGAR